MIRLLKTECGRHEVYDESGTLLAIVTGEHHLVLRGIQFPDIDDTRWAWSAEGHFTKVTQ
jgi:hypothetical protein